MAEVKYNFDKITKEELINCLKTIIENDLENHFLSSDAFSSISSILQKYKTRAKQEIDSDIADKVREHIRRGHYVYSIEIEALVNERYK